MRYIFHSYALNVPFAFCQQKFRISSNFPDRQLRLLNPNVLEQAWKHAELNTAMNRLIGLLQEVWTFITGSDSKVTEMASNVTQLSSRFAQVDIKGLKET
jgi:hypothetical protein